MNNSKMENRQNRTLAVIIAVILAFASVLICLTLMQDRRDTPPPLLPADSTSDKADTNDTDASLNTDANSAPESTAPTQDTAPLEPETTDAAAQVPEDEPVIAEETIPNFISPVAGVLSQPHNTEVPVYSLTMNDYRTHAGVDILAVSGASVCAAADGTVGEIWEEPMMGVCLSIEHKGGARSIYKNLSPQLPDGITVGTAVRAGDRIGAIGESALMEIADSPHLHYELEIDGVSVDPADYMLIGSDDTGYEG